MNHFFVPVDFSSNAQVALRYAGNLAKAIGDTAIKVHYLMEDADYQDEAKRQAAQKSLEDFAAYSLSKVEGGGELACSATLSGGDKLTELIQTPAYQEAELVVMGTKGASGFLKELRGSNTYAIVRESTKPVLVVPGHASFAPMRYILYCADFERITDLTGLDLVKKFAMQFSAEVRIAHVKVSRDKTTHEHNFESHRQASFFDPEVKYSFKTIRHKTILGGIKYYIDLKKDNQLVVMVRRERGMLEELFLTNHTREMVFHTKLPLLVLV